MHRNQLKRGVERVLVRSGIASTLARLMKGRVLVLAYHNILPRGLVPLGDRSLHLSLDAFRDQLDALAARCEIVPLQAILGVTTSGERPRVAITFDDAYRGAVTSGVEELAARGLPATIFVAPALLGDQTFWWDEAGAGCDGGLGDILRDGALWGCRGEATSVRSWLQQRGVSLRPDVLPAPARSADLGELLGAVRRHPGLTVGAHSWSHANLAALDESALNVQLKAPLDWMVAHFPGATAPWLAYPYGLESPAVQHMAREAGYVGGLLVSGGWVKPGTGSPFVMPRLNVASGMSAEGLVLRLTGVLRR